MFHQYCVCVYSLYTSLLGNYRDQDGEEDVDEDIASRQRAIYLAWRVRVRRQGDHSSGGGRSNSMGLSIQTIPSGNMYDMVA
jgi:hypothetical protein